MTHTIKMFLKFGNKENIQDLFNNGTIYLNTIEYFRKIESDDFRGDKYEGASRIINSFPGTFRIQNIDREFHYKKVHLKESYEIVLGNLYCLYCVSSYGFPNPLDFMIDPRNLKFGTHCLVIKDNLYFLKSLEEALKERGLKYKHGFVDYYDKETVSKNLTLFDKSNEYEHQKEFRIYVQNEELKPISLTIGSLHGKAEIFTIEDAIQFKLVQP